VKNHNDPDPEKKKVTNSDEQEVAVNYSTQENGFDEPDPTSRELDKSPEEDKEVNQKESEKEKTSETFKE
jgi:hypothetical protein